MKKDEKWRLILIGHLPPPITGQSIAFTTLIEFIKWSGMPYITVDIAWRGDNRPFGQFSLRRTIEVLRALSRYLRYIWRSSQIVYLSIGQSILGFCRDFIFIWFASMRHHRIVVQLHGGGYNHLVNAQHNFIQQLIISTFKRVDTIVVLSANLIEQFNFLPRTHPEIRVLHNCLPNELSVSQEPKIWTNNIPINILYLSNLMETKGYWDVLEAIRLLKEKGVDVAADFCGSFIVDSGSQYLNETAAKDAFLTTLKNPIFDSKIKYHGSVFGKQKRELLEKASVFALPTYHPTEGQPISIIEAIASGLPVISTNYRGIPEMVHDGINGFLVSPRSPSEISDRISKIYHSTELYNQMSKASLQIYKQSFTREVIRDRFLNTIFGENEISELLQRC